MTRLADSVSRYARWSVPSPQPLLLAAFFGALPVSISAAQLVSTVLIVLAFPWRWTSVARFRHYPVTVPFLALTGLTVLSAVASGDPGWSLWIARDTLRITTFYVILGLTRDSAQAFRLWQGFLAMLTLMAVYGLAQAYACAVRPTFLSEGWLSKLCLDPARIRGPFSIYMTFGGVLMLGALIFLAVLANVPWRSVWWMIPGVAVTITALAFTYARNAWVGLLAGTLILVTAGRRVTPVAGLLIGVAMLFATFAPSTVGQRVRSIVDLHDPTIRDRLAMWRSGLGMIHDHPILGVGPGEVRAWYPHYRLPEAVRLSTGHLHNSPIHIAAERGLPAFAVWMWLWIAFFRAGFRILPRIGHDRARDRALVSASLAGVMGFLVAGLFEHTFGKGQIMMLVYALMALPFIIEREHVSQEGLLKLDFSDGSACSGAEMGGEQAAPGGGPGR